MARAGAAGRYPKTTAHYGAWRRLSIRSSGLIINYRSSSSSAGLRHAGGGSVVKLRPGDCPNARRQEHPPGQAAIERPVPSRRTGLNAFVVSQFINDPDRGVPDPRARLGPPGPAQLDRQGHRALLDRPACQDHPVRLGPLVRPARPAHQGRQGPRVQGRPGQVPQAHGDDVQRLTVRIRLIPLSEASLGPTCWIVLEESRRTTWYAQIEFVLRNTPVGDDLSALTWPVPVDYHHPVLQLRGWRASPAGQAPGVASCFGKRIDAPPG